MESLSWEILKTHLDTVLGPAGASLLRHLEHLPLFLLLTLVSAGVGLFFNRIAVNQSVVM